MENWIWERFRVRWECREVLCSLQRSVVRIELFFLLKSATQKVVEFERIRVGIDCIAMRLPLGVRSYSFSSRRTGAKLTASLEKKPAKATPLAPNVPHASPTLVSLDTFFAQDRPLLEWSLRLSNRRSVQSPVARLSPLEAALEDADAAEIHALETVELDSLSLEADELVEVVDLSPEGTPIGNSYITTLSSSAAQSLAQHEQLQAEVNDAERELQALEDSIEEGVDPYEPWLIAEPEQGNHPWSPTISRYLASQSHFVPPPPPALPLSPPVSQQSLLKSTKLPSSFVHSPQTIADLVFLRPFTPVVPPKPTHATEDSTNPSTFLARFANPLSPSLSQAVADRFLSAASLSHRWRAQVDYASASAEAMESARRAYAGEDVSQRGTAGRIKRRGDLRIWSAEEGWKFVNLSRSKVAREGSPFLPAEMVDLDWVDQIGLNGENMDEVAPKEKRGMSAAGPRSVAERGYRIGMDSVKRKRKKKITKHKFKKRRFVFLSLSRLR